MPSSSLQVWKCEYRAVIKYFIKKGNSAIIINEKLSIIYPEYTVSFATAERWIRLFKNGR